MIFEIMAGVAAMRGIAAAANAVKDDDSRAETKESLFQMKDRFQDWMLDNQEEEQEQRLAVLLEVLSNSRHYSASELAEARREVKALEKAREEREARRRHYEEARLDRRQRAQELSERRTAQGFDKACAEEERQRKQAQQEAEARKREEASAKTELVADARRIMADPESSDSDLAFARDVLERFAHA